MKRNCLLIILLAFLSLCRFLFSDSGVICNSTSWRDLPNFPLSEYRIVDYRYYIPVESLEFSSNLNDRFMDDLKNSKLLYFGQSGLNYDMVFGNPLYREAVRKFLESGGTIIFDGVPSGKEVQNFLKEAGVTVPKPGSIKGVAGENIYPVVSDLENEKNYSILKFPNELKSEEKLKLCITFESWSENQIAPLRASADSKYAVMVIQENVCGKGRIIFNGIYNIFSHPTRGQLYVENIFSYVFGKEIKRVPTADKRYRTNREYIIWYKTPYSKFPLEEDAPEKNKANRIDIKACINEVIGTNILITNGKKGELKFEVEAGEIKDKDTGKNIPEKNIRIMELEFDGGRMPDRMPEKKEFNIGEGSTGIVWISLDTSGLEEGNYSGDIILRFGDRKQERINLNVRIYPIKLQKTNPLKLTVWDLVPGGGREKMIGGSENWIKYHKDMIEHGVNVFHLSSLYEGAGITFNQEGEAVKKDFSRFDAGIPFKEKEYVYLINMGSHTQDFRVEGKKEAVQYGSELWERCYRNWVKNIVEHMKEIGLDYSQFAFYPYDEIRSGTVPDALKIYSLIKETDKKARIFVTLGTASEMEFFEAKKGLPVKEIAPYIDIWCPAIPYENYWTGSWSGTKQFDRILEFLRNTGKEIWSYNVLVRSHFEIIAYKKYRLQPLGAYRLGIGGYGFYGYNLWKNDPYMVVYPGENPITSYRWEAMREGMNDVKYIEALKQEMKKTREERKRKEAEQLIQEFLKQVTENNENPEIVYQYREKISEKILELRK